MAAFVATPPAPAYAASKAAVERWAVGIAHGTRAEGVLVSSIYPGFVHHESQERTVFPMPRLMDADRAARAILLGIARGRTRITFRWYIGVIGQLTALLPPRLFAALTVAHVARESGR